MIIRNNTMGLRAYNANRKTTGSIKKNLEKLSSGYRINRAADDAAGLGVSERILAKVTELDRCEDNATEGIDLARTADAALQEVNDMLKRARSLCIEAANGTYSDQELAAISDEMNHLFDEIDRISAGSYHNSINLFRQDIGQTYHEEYDEEFTPVEDLLQLWGQMEFIESDKFDPAVEAVPATTTFELDDSVDPADPKTMEGKALRIGNYTYYFTGNSAYPAGTYKVAIADTMEKTLENLVARSAAIPYSDAAPISGASIDGRTVTLTAALKGLDYVTNNIPYTAPDGDAEWAHNTSVTSPTGVGTLGVIDGTDATDNAPVYETPVVLEYNLGKTGTISQDDINNLKQNTFGLYLSTNGSTSSYRDVAVNLSSLDLGGAVTTWEQFGTELAKKITAEDKYTASYADGKLTVSYAADTKSPTRLHTSVQTGTTGGTPSQTLETWTSTGVNFTVKQDNQGGMESVEQCSVEIPALDGKIPFSFSVDGYTYLYYNPDDPAYTAYTNQPNVSLTTSYSNNTYSVGSSVSQAKVANDILSRVRNAMGGSADVRVEGNKLVITAKRTNTGSSVYNSLNTLFRSTTHNIYAVQAGTPGTSSKPVIPNTTTYSKEQDVTITFDLGSNVKSLEGKGFSIGLTYSSTRTKIEFINSDNCGSLRDDYSNDIDLKTLTSLEDVRKAVADRLGSRYTVVLDGSQLKISTKTTSDASYYNRFSVTDGILGMEPLSKGGAVKFEGGVNVGQSQKAIDFSSITEDNIDTLLGKGFRIDCATCSGEYINVFFCWANDGSVPATFERQDPVTGLMRTIHNIPVELSKITSGDKIVEDIVQQVRPTLRHYTDVAVGDPPTILLAMEKRLGDVKDNAGNLYLGRIETGVEVNFTYDVEHKLVPDLPEGDLDKLKTAVVNIYVGSDPEPQLIPIHLPYIDMTYLRLRPPELVDLTDSSQSPSDWLGRVDRADLAISDARGTIGADYNRLEHAIQDLSNANIQLSDAYSTIRDADMADLMMKQVKDQILLQAQQSMLSQANQAPQAVLQLMQ